MKSNIIYKKINEDSLTEFQFIRSDELPDLPILTPLTIPFIGSDVVLVYHANRKWWDIPGGKMEKGETYEQTTVREVHEEACLSIDENKLVVLGYIEATTKNNSGELITVSVLPVTISFVLSIQKFEVTDEILKRFIVNKKEADHLLSGREDGGQMSEIISAAYSWMKINLKEESFVYESGSIEDQIPLTQCMSLVTNVEGKYCVVRDFGEEIMSLPGGMCNLGESAIECARREIREEAQFEVEDPFILGSFVVTYVFNDGYLYKFRQARVGGFIREVHGHVPGKDGFEVEERKFITEEELLETVPMMQYETSLLFLNDFKQK